MNGVEPLRIVARAGTDWTLQAERASKGLLGENARSADGRNGQLGRSCDDYQCM
jgi:hypothetical protein